MWIIFKIPLARISNQALNFRMRSGERCCCSRCRDDPETSGPHRDLGESRENGEHGGAAQERKQGRCDDGPASGGIRNAGARYPKAVRSLTEVGAERFSSGLRAERRRIQSRAARPGGKVGRKVRCRIPGRRTCGPQGSRREAGIGCRVARPSPKGGAARWVSGVAGGQDTQVVWKVGASRTAGMVKPERVSQGRRSDDAGRRARKRPPFLLSGQGARSARAGPVDLREWPKAVSLGERPVQLR